MGNNFSYDELEYLKCILSNMSKAEKWDNNKLEQLVLIKLNNNKYQLSSEEVESLIELLCRTVKSTLGNNRRLHNSLINKLSNAVSLLKTYKYEYLRKF